MSKGVKEPILLYKIGSHELMLFDKEYEYVSPYLFRCNKQCGLICVKFVSNFQEINQLYHARFII